MPNPMFYLLQNLAPPGGGGPPSGEPAAGDVVFIAAADHEIASGTAYYWPIQAPNSIASGVTGAHGKVYAFTSTAGAFADLPGNYQTISARMRFRPTQTTEDRILIFRDDTNVNQVAFRLIGDGSFTVVRGTTTTIAGPSATGLWAVDNWYTVEFKAHIDNSPNGNVSASLYDDAGALIATISASGIDTQNTAVAYVHRIGVGGQGVDPYVDDVSVDGTGELHGVCQVETLMPTGAGDLAAHTRGGADSGANWSQCEENPDDQDTSYVQSAGTDQDDCYVFADRSLSGENRAIQVTAIAKLAGGASRQIKLFVRMGGVTYLGSTTHTLTSSYLAYHECWANNPATGNAWTDSEINSAQFGFRSLTTDCRITQVALQVLVGL
jgi:hypothetical protein